MIHYALFLDALFLAVFAAMPQSSLAHTSTEFHFTVDLPYHEAAPLFGALEEQKWAPGWKPEFLHPTPATDQEGSVFRVQKGAHSSLWVNTVFDLATGRVQYVYVLADLLVTRIDILIKVNNRDKTDVSVTYERTALTSSANDHVKALAKEDAASGEEWKSLINAYAARMKPTR